MYPFQRLMIGLDFTSMDSGLIKYVASLCPLIKPQQICFVHVQDQSDLQSELSEAFPSLVDPQVETLQKELAQAVEEHFEGYHDWKKSITFQVLEGSPRKVILNQVRDLNIDLLILGRKTETSGSGVLSSQLTRKASCSVLFVPDEPPLKLENILVGFDFSSHAQLAWEEALALKERSAQDITITIQHIYQVPRGYYKTGRTESQFAILMHQHAEKRLVKFAEEHNLNLSSVEILFTYDRQKSSTAVLLQREAQRREADLVMVAARGLGSLSAFFLGSVTEKLIKMEGNIPILVVKREISDANLA